jgi:L-ornithine N5-monooxygenase
LNDQVEYGIEVLSVEPVVGTENDTETVQLLKVLARDVRTGEHKEYLTSHLVVAAGGAPQVPDEIAHVRSDRVFHSHEFLPKMEAGFPDQDKPYRFAVIGAGQSAAEIFYHLFSTYDRADVSVVFRQFAFKPADDSSFVNEIFFPQQVDFLYSLTPEKRQKLLEAHSDTNYSVVDLDLIKRIYKSMYEEKVIGRDRIHVMPLMNLVNLTDNGDSVTAHFNHMASDESHVDLECDAVILATGYSRKAKQKLLQNLAPYLLTQESGEYEIERDYRIMTKPNFEPTIFMQGYCENTHGLSDTLLSILPIRSQEIVNALIQARNANHKISYAI